MDLSNLDLSNLNLGNLDLSNLDLDLIKTHLSNFITTWEGWSKIIEGLQGIPESFKLSSKIVDNL